MKAKSVKVIAFCTNSQPLKYRNVKNLLSLHQWLRSRGYHVTAYNVYRNTGEFYKQYKPENYLPYHFEDLI